MPEVFYDVCWPNGQTEKCYSPSSVIKDFIKENEIYPLPEFLELAAEALNEASERVRAKYGYACSSAMDQLRHFRAKAEEFSSDSNVYIKRIY